VDGSEPTKTAASETPAAPAGVPRWLIPAAVVALLAITAVLAVGSLWRDSITYDETSHLTAGMSNLLTDDYRLAPDHPPLGKMWAAWPLLLMHTKWPGPDDHGWQIADVLLVGRKWLFELNDGERLMRVARCMMVVLLLGVCAAIYFSGRRLFGPGAGLLALVIAVLSPTLMAHGRLVTTDVPVTLCITLTLLTFARLLQRVTWARLAAVALALGAASVSKMSWPLVLPALAVMAIVALVRRAPIEVPGSGLLVRQREPAARWRPMTRRPERAVLLVTISIVLAATTWVSIWTCYRWKLSMYGTSAAAGIGSDVAANERLTESLQIAWARALTSEDGQPRKGVLPALLRWAADRTLLPEAYLFGLAWTLENTSGRAAYLCGRIAQHGWWWYFPLAFAIKTPIATMALLAAGMVAILKKRGRSRDPVLLAGFVAFVVFYWAYAIRSNFNIGERHLLPAYPMLYVFAGASATWLSTRIGRWLVPPALLWLVGANCWIYPQYLCYFNELVGGPRNGQYYLADSNIDWGQDLLRLTDYSHRHPGETIKLSYFGSAVPAAYGFPCELLPSSMETGSPKYLDGGGLYVISETHWVGVYDTRAQDSFWQQPATVEAYRRAGQWLRTPVEGESADEHRAREKAAEEYGRLRWGRFLYNLRRRPIEERVGYSLFVYHLTAADIDTLTAP
jgi:hypothetical protein